MGTSLQKWGTAIVSNLGKTVETTRRRSLHHRYTADRRTVALTEGRFSRTITIPADIPHRRHARLSGFRHAYIPPHVGRTGRRHSCATRPGRGPRDLSLKDRIERAARLAAHRGPRGDRPDPL